MKRFNGTIAAHIATATALCSHIKPHPLLLILDFNIDLLPFTHIYHFKQYKSGYK